MALCLFWAYRNSVQPFSCCCVLSDARGLTSLRQSTCPDQQELSVAKTRNGHFSTSLTYGIAHERGHQDNQKDLKISWSFHWQNFLSAPMKQLLLILKFCRNIFAETVLYLELMRKQYTSGNWACLALLSCFISCSVSNFWEGFLIPFFLWLMQQTCFKILAFSRIFYKTLENMLIFFWRSRRSIFISLALQWSIGHSSRISAK